MNLPQTPDEAVMKILERKDLPQSFRNFLENEAEYRLGVSFDNKRSTDQFKPTD